MNRTENERGKKTAVVLGASPKSDRYGNRAQKRLMDAGYPVIPVNPAYDEIEGVRCAASLEAAAANAGENGIDTLTVYVGPAHLVPLTEEIIRANPRRVIFNPGTESKEVQDALDASGIPWKQACTLVLLSTGQY